MIHQRDRWTDRQTTCDSKIALCTIVHCAVKTNLRRVSNLALPPELQMLWSFQLQGVLPPDSPVPTEGIPTGGSTTDPYMGSQSCARHDQGSSPPNVISWPRPELNFLHTLCQYQCPMVGRVGNRDVWQCGQTENQGGQTKKFFGALRRILSNKCLPTLA